MLSFKKIVLFNIIANFALVYSSRILAVFPFNGKSHDMMFNALLTGLAKRDHQVDVITHFPPKNPPPNYKVIVNLNGTLPPTVNNFTFDFVTMSDAIASVGEIKGNKICELLGLEEMQKLIKNPPTDPPYDVVITEAFEASCFMGLGHVFKVPVIGVTTSVEFPWIADYTGNVDNLAFVQSYFMDSFDKRKFFDRLLNFVSHYWHVRKFQKSTDDVQTDLMRKYLRPDMPSVREVERSLALILTNRHPVINGLKPVGSSFVEVSGLHLEGNDHPKLSTEFAKWLDESKDGVIYFSFGSMVLIETMPAEIIQEMYRSFAKIAPMRVLMKVSNDSMLPPGLPTNVKLFSWISQQAVLAHENVRIFMTHGGLMGSQEALYHGVPMIGIPLFSDQPQNVNRFVEMNVAVKINCDNITAESLDEAFNTVLNDSKYRDSVRYYSRLFRDRPMTAMDTAVYWIEYVIRNGNVLRSPALELTWWQLSLVDVYSFILMAVIVVLGLLHCMVNYLTKKVVFIFFYKFDVIEKLKIK